MTPFRILALVSALIASLEAGPGHTQTCTSNVTTTLAALPVAGATTSATASLPWPEAPTAQSVRLRVVQESSGDVLGDTDGSTTAIVPQLTPASAGKSASIGLLMDMLRTPLGGAKLVQASWGSGQDAKTACLRIRLAAAPPADASTTWLIDGVPADRLPADGTLSGARVDVRVMGSGLWKDVSLQLDPRLATQLVSNVGSAQLAATAAGATATFPLTLKTPYQAQGARYAAHLRSEGWTDPVQLASLPVRGPAPRFLPNAEAGGEYSVAASAIAPTVTIQGANLGLTGEESQMSVRVRAFNAADVQFDERPPLTRTLGACAAGGQQCLTLMLERPSIAARRYEVVLTTAGGQETPAAARVRTQANVFTLSKIESNSGEVVFSGRPATLRTTVDANAGGQAPSAVRIDGQPAVGWTPNLAGTTLTLTGVPIPALGDNVDRAQLVLTLEFPNGNSAVGALTALQVPIIEDTPVRIYGGREQTVTLGGQYLSDVSVLAGNVVTPTQVTSGANRLSLTLGTADAAPAQESLTVRRAGYPLLTLPVQVVSRPAVATNVHLATTRTQLCPNLGGVAFEERARVVVPAGGSLCVRIEPDLSVSMGVRDSVQVKISYEGTSVGTPTEIVYNVRAGATRLVPLVGVEPGSTVDVDLVRGEQKTTARAVTSIRQRLGFLAAVTGAQIRPFRTERGEAASEEWRPTSADNVLNLGIGIYGRPLNNRFFTMFAGFTQSTRSFCQNTTRATTANQPAAFAGVSLRWLALGIGSAIGSANIPDSCTAPAEGTAPGTVADRGRVWFFVGPAVKL